MKNRISEYLNNPVESHETSWYIDYHPLFEGLCLFKRVEGEGIEVLRYQKDESDRTFIGLALVERKEKFGHIERGDVVVSEGANIITHLNMRTLQSYVLMFKQWGQELGIN